jgi:hypothetical protein
MEYRLLRRIAPPWRTKDHPMKLASSPRVARCSALSSILLSALVLAGDTPPQPAPAPETCAAFEKMKSLAGEWTAVRAESKAAMGPVTYKVSAGGTVLLETLFVGTDHEMLSVYYADAGELAMTHYCILHNRPNMRARASSDPKKIVLECAAGSGLRCDVETHMHQATITFVDDDHVKTEWTLYEKGKATGTHGFDLERKKPAK